MEVCPVEYALDTLAGKWKMYTIFVLSQNETIRFNELQRQVGKISAHMLSRTLGELEESGIVKRIEYKVVPPHVEYFLSDLGKKLIPALNSIGEWGNLILTENEKHDTI